jgi:rod shape-determining protein MreD
MVARKILVLGLLVVLALVLQTSVVNLLPLPFGPPSLVLLLVVAAALALGSYDGMVLGFLAGLATDTLSDHPLGLLALVCCVTGYLAGKAAGLDSAMGAVLIVAFATGAAMLAFAGLLGLLGTGRLGWPVVSRTVPAAAVYNLMLAPFVVPVVAKLSGWFTRRREMW